MKIQRDSSCNHLQQNHCCVLQMPQNAPQHTHMTFQDLSYVKFQKRLIVQPSPTKSLLCATNAPECTSPHTKTFQGQHPSYLAITGVGNLLRESPQMAAHYCDLLALHLVPDFLLLLYFNLKTLYLERSFCCRIKLTNSGRWAI